MSAFHDYDNLCASIGRLLARPDLRDDIPGWVWLAECDIQRRVHMRTTDKVAVGETVDTQDWIDLPGDYVEGRYLEWTNDNTIAPLSVASLDTVDRIGKVPGAGAQSTQVRVGAVHGQRIYVGVTPGELEYRLFYQGGVDHLSETVQTNRILQMYPDLLLYGAALHSAPFLGADERIQVWRGMFEPGIGEARQQEWRSRTGHGPLVMRPDVSVY